MFFSGLISGRFGKLSFKTTFFSTLVKWPFFPHWGGKIITQKTAKKHKKNRCPKMLSKSCLTLLFNEHFKFFRKKGRPRSWFLKEIYLQLSTTGKLRNDKQIHWLHFTPSNTSLWVVKKFHAKNMFLRLEIATKLKVQKCCQKSCNYYLRSYTSISSFSVKKQS